MESLLSCIRGLGALLELLWETWDFSRFAAEKKGLLSSCSGDLGVYLELQRKTWGSSRVAAGDSELLSRCTGNSVFLLCCSLGLRVPLELWWVTWGFSRVWEGYLGFLLTCRGASSRVALGKFISSRDVQSGSCLVAMSGGYSLDLAWNFPIIVVRVNSVVVGSILFSVQASLYLWC